MCLRGMIVKVVQPGRPREVARVFGFCQASARFWLAAFASRAQDRTVTGELTDESCPGSGHPAHV